MEKSVKYALLMFSLLAILSFIYIQTGNTFFVEKIGGNQANATFKKFVNYYNEENANDLYELFSSQVKASHWNSKPKAVAEIKSLITSEQGSVTVKDWSTLREKRGDNSSLMEVKVMLKVDAPKVLEGTIFVKRFNISLVKEGVQWKFDRWISRWWPEAEVLTSQPLQTFEKYMRRYNNRNKKLYDLFSQKVKSKHSKAEIDSLFRRLEKNNTKIIDSESLNQSVSNASAVLTVTPILMKGKEVAQRRYHISFTREEDEWRFDEWYTNFSI